MKIIKIIFAIYCIFWLLAIARHIYKETFWFKWVWYSIKFIWLYPKVKKDLSMYDKQTKQDLLALLDSRKSWSANTWFYKKYYNLLKLSLQKSCF